MGLFCTGEDFRSKTKVGTEKETPLGFYLGPNETVAEFMKTTKNSPWKKNAFMT